MTCNKMRFPSRAAAKAWDREARAHSRDGNARKMTAYECPICADWHLTSLSKTEARRRQRTFWRMDST